MCTNLACIPCYCLLQLTNEQQAEALKAQGNNRFEQKQFRDAITFYSKAIALCPNTASYYANRAAAWLMVGACSECISDCQAAVKRDPTYVKGYIRMAKALCEQGKYDQAIECLTLGQSYQSETVKEIQDNRNKIMAIQKTFERVCDDLAPNAHIA